MKKKILQQEIQPVQDLDSEIGYTNAMNSFVCNVTEYGGRKKIYQDRQKHKELKQGDTLIQESQKSINPHDAGLSSIDQVPVGVRDTTDLSKSFQFSQNKPTENTQNINFIQLTTQKKQQTRKGKNGAGFSDKMSMNSNDSRRSQYKNLSINIKQANAIGAVNQEGLSHHKSSARRTSVESSFSRPNSQPSTFLHVQSLASQPKSPSPIQIKSPIKAPKEHLNAIKPSQADLQFHSSANIIQNATQQQQKNMENGEQRFAMIQQAQQAMKKQRDLQDMAVSPFHQSQVSYSDYQQYQNYFEKDNKDGYFRNDQMQYYLKEYPKTNQHTQKPLPITKWQLGKMIGHGSFGDVYEGIDKQHGRQIAVKQVPISKIGNNHGTQQRKLRALKQEIKLLSGLQHQNIVKFLGTNEDGEHLNVFLEYVAQGSLEQHYKKFQLNEQCLATYTKQILLGLEYLHYNNIVHRDIKAANILIRDNGMCQLADFGSSKKIIENNQQAHTKSFCGTPYWMAPEVVKQSGHNRFADIWSLGCTVYEMIVREPPWIERKENSVFKVLNKISNATKPPKYPAGISPALKDFLDACFQLEPRMRANVYELLRHPFITREEFSTQLAYQHRLQPINEQLSQMSDASPWTNRHKGFFSKIDQKQYRNYQQQQLQAQNTGAIPDRSPNLQSNLDRSPMKSIPDRSPNLQYHDVSPYSQVSAKTQGDKPYGRQQKFQFRTVNRNNSSMIMDREERQVPKVASFQKSKSNSKSNSHGYSIINTSKRSGLPGGGQSSSRQSSGEKRSSGAQGQSSLAETIEESKIVHEANFQGLSRAHQPHNIPYLQTIQEISRLSGPLLESTPQVEQQEESSIQQQSNEYQYQQANLLRQKILPESGDSEHENNPDKAKRSLNVESAGTGARQSIGNNTRANQNSANFPAEVSDSSSDNESLMVLNQAQINGQRQDSQSEAAFQRDLIAMESEERKGPGPIIERSGLPSNSGNLAQNTEQFVDFGLSPIEPQKRNQWTVNNFKDAEQQTRQAPAKPRKSLEYARVRLGQDSIIQDQSQDKQSQISFGDAAKINMSKTKQEEGGSSTPDSPQQSSKCSLQLQAKSSESASEQQIINQEAEKEPGTLIAKSPCYHTKTTSLKTNPSSKQQQMRHFAERFHKSRGLEPTNSKDEDSPKSREATRPSQGQVFANQQPAMNKPIGGQKPMLQPFFDNQDGLMQIGFSHGSTSQLASQLNKLSLDNNLTDIEEDENENMSQKNLNTSMQSSQLLQRKSLPNRPESPHDQALMDISVEQASTNREGQISSRIKEDMPLQAMRQASSVHLQASSATSSIKMTSETCKHSSDNSQNQAQKSPASAQQLSSSPSVHFSPSKKPQLQKVEDQIMVEVAKAEAAKKREQVSIGAKPASSNAGNSRMKKARNLMIPKIFVANSNKEPSNEERKGEPKSAIQATILASSINNAADSINQPQNASKDAEAQRPAQDIQKIKQERPSNEEETKRVIEADIKSQQAEQQVLFAIAQQQQKKKQVDIPAPVDRVSDLPAEDPIMQLLNLDGGSSDDSSSYKSPEVDSDELAALGDDNLV